MSVEKKIVDTVGALVSGQIAAVRYVGTATTYITFNMQEVGDLYAESEPQTIRQLVQLHLYIPHETNPRTIKKSITKALIGAGFAFSGIINASDKDGQHYVWEFESTDNELLQ